jgi:DnaJ-class molecular chaperone
VTESAGVYIVTESTVYRRVVAYDLCDVCDGIGHDDNPLWPQRCQECDGTGLVEIEAVAEELLDARE